MNLDKSHQKYFGALCMHGIIVFQKVIDRLISEEKYEMAKKATDTINEYCRVYKMPVPEPIKDIEDFKLEFWRIGLSGEIAAENFDYYQEKCYRELIKIYK